MIPRAGVATTFTNTWAWILQLIYMSKLFARRDAIRTWIKAPEMVRRAHCDHVDPPTHPAHARGVEGCGSCTSRKHEDHTDKSGMSSKYDHFLSHEAMASNSRAQLNCSLLYGPFNLPQTRQRLRFPIRFLSRYVSTLVTLSKLSREMSVPIYSYSAVLVRFRPQADFGVGLCASNFKKSR